MSAVPGHNFLALKPNLTGLFAWVSYYYSSYIYEHQQLFIIIYCAKFILRLCLTVYRSLMASLSQVFLSFTGGYVLEYLSSRIFPLTTMQTLGVFGCSALTFTLLKLTPVYRGNLKHFWDTFHLLSYALLVEIFGSEN